MIVVRPAGESDVDAVLRITIRFATSFSIEEAAFRPSFSEALADERACVLIAELDGDVIGYLLGFEHPTLHANGPVTWVDELAVDELHHRSGVGRALMAAAEDWARKRGNVMVNLATRRAGVFYLALGYEESAAYFRKPL